MSFVFRVLDKLLVRLLFILLLLMVIVVASNVFGRFLLGNSISWGEEVAKMLLTYLTFFGAAYTMKDNSHYSFDFIIQKLPPKINRFFLIFRWVIIIAISCLLIYWTSEVTIKIRDWIMPSTGFNKMLIYGAVPISFFFMLLYSLRNLILVIRNKQILSKEWEDKNT